MPLASLLVLVGMLIVFGHIGVVLTCVQLCIFVFCVLGWGILVLQGLKKEEKAWDLCFVLGISVWGMLCFACFALGIWNSLFMMLLGMCGGFGWYLHRPTWPQFDEVSLWGLGSVALATSLDAWGPLIDVDALYYHQALAKQMVLQNALLGGWFDPNGSRPMLLHSVYASAWDFLGEKGPSFCHWTISMVLLGSLIERSKTGIWGMLLFLSSWSVLQEMGVLSNNLPTALAIFLTWRMVSAGEYTVASLCAFVALSYKFTSLGLISGMWLLYIEGYKSKIRVLLVVACLSAIWPIRNLIDGLPVLFPFVGWNEPFQYVEKYGMGRDIQDFFLLPWNVLVHAQIDSHIFQGRLSPMVLVVFLCLWNAPKRDSILFGIGCVFWAMGPQWLRHFVLLLPILVFIVGENVHKVWVQRVMFVGFLLGVGENWGPIFSRWSASWGVIRGEVQEEAYLEEHVVGYKALTWVDHKLPSDSCAALAYVWAGSVLNRRYILSSLEDHIPIRHWLKTHQKTSLSVLPCEYIVVGNHAMDRKRYSFLSEEVYEAQVKAPILLLEELLLQQGILIYTAKGVRVYRVEKEVDKI